MHINKIFFAGGYSPASCFFSGADSVKNTAALALATHNEEIIFVKDLATAEHFFIPIQPLALIKVLCLQEKQAVCG